MEPFLKKAIDYATNNTITRYEFTLRQKLDDLILHEVNFTYVDCLNFLEQMGYDITEDYTEFYKAFQASKKDDLEKVNFQLQAYLSTLEAAILDRIDNFKLLVNEKLLNLDLQMDTCVQKLKNLAPNLKLYHSFSEQMKEVLDYKINDFELLQENLLFTYVYKDYYT